MNEKFIKNEREMIKFGEKIIKELPKNPIIFLKGPLGSGKTTFVKGIARGLGMKEEEIKSPSFLIIHSYEKLIHIDLYRLQNSGFDQLEDIGIFSYLNENKTRVIEWPLNFLLKIYKNGIIFNFNFKGDGRNVTWEI